jgi:hypothetical protein
LWEARAKELQRKRGKREGRSQPTGPTLTHACPKRAAHLHQWTGRFEVTRIIPLPKWERCSKLLTSAGKKDREGTTSSRAAKPQENGPGLSSRGICGDSRPRLSTGQSPVPLTLALPVWDGHSCPSPLTLLLILICHPEEAESHAKRATPNEGPMHFLSPV